MSRLTRRQALSAAVGATAGLAVTGAAFGTAQAAASGGTGRTEAAGSQHAVHQAAPGSFDEVYRGRRIQGGPADGGGHGGHDGGHHGGGYTVRIDGDELHVMRNADGTWISVVNHYEPRSTLRALARAAVIDLQGADLVPLASLSS